MVNFNSASNLEDVFVFQVFFLSPDVYVYPTMILPPVYWFQEGEEANVVKCIIVKAAKWTHVKYVIFSSKVYNAFCCKSIMIFIAVYS